MEPQLQMEDNAADQSPRSENNVNIACKIDGVQIIASSWNFVFPMKTIRINSPLFVKRENTRSIFKGSRYIRDSCFVWTIYLFESCDLTIKVCFWGDFESLGYDKLVKLMYKSIDESLQKFPDSDTSKCILQKVKLNDKRTKRDSVKIMCCDYGVIGEELTKNIRINLHVMFERPVYFAFVGICLGQNMELDYMASRLQSLNTEPMLEVLLHHAFDCTSPGKLILWRRNGIVEQMNGRPPNYEYYPLAIPNHGNYYYSELQTTLVSSALNTSSVTMWKCYGENSKHVHDGLLKPFKKSEVGNYIMDFTSTGFLLKTLAAKKKFQEQTQMYLDQAEILDKLVKSAKENRLNSARIEFIVSTLAARSMHRPLETVFPKDFPSLSAKTAFAYSEEFGLISEETVSLHRETLVFERYSLYFPAISALLRRHLKGVMDYLSDQLNFFSFSMNDYLNVVAAEAVTSFLLYGTAVSTDTSKHNNNLCRDLGIVGHRFRKPAVNLDLMIHFGNDVIRFSNADDENLREFVYSPRFDWTHLLKNISAPINIARVVQCCSSASPNFEMISKLLLDVVVHSSLSFVKAATNTLGIMQTTVYCNFYQRHEYHTAFQFCQLLFSMNSGQLAGHFGLLWLVNHITVLLGTRKKIYKFKLFFSKFLDEKLYNEGTYLAICFPKTQCTIIIVPFLRLLKDQDINKKLSTMLNVYKVKFWKKEKEQPHAGLRGFLKWCKKMSDVEIISFKKINSAFNKIHAFTQCRLFEEEDIIGFSHLE